MDQASSIELVKQVLGDDYLDLRIESYVLHENWVEERCHVRCTVIGHDGQGRREITGEGVGFIDAVFHAFQKAYVDQFPSLKSICFAGFTVKADFDTKRDATGSDAVGQVVLLVRNSRGRLFEFAHASRSVTRSAMVCTLQAIEYFVNTERAFIVLHRALQDARQRNRADLVERYSLQLAQLVENTSYSEVIERMHTSDG